MRERQNLENTAANMENTALEHMESSQESVEILQSPSTGNTSLWLNELVLLGQRASERDTETDTGDNSVESSQHRVTPSQHDSLVTDNVEALMFHPLLTRLRSKEPSLTTAADGAPTPGGVVMPTVAGTEEAAAAAAGEQSEEDEFPQLPDDSTEKADGLTFNLLDHPYHHGYHGNEDGLELGL
ncbi:hypothetical protein Q5P01_003117 [Channa striata]|uniref:Uncharacterized protein n=1 Tax=Channa striata TaxID=64152 RepID=A0AA88T8R4_CHASR|nr:hypothetical protein Q5P01_003117 [Channa striata]